MNKSVESYKVVKEKYGDFIISLRSFQGGIEYVQYYNEELKMAQALRFS